MGFNVRIRTEHIRKHIRIELKPLQEVVSNISFKTVDSTHGLRAIRESEETDDCVVATEPDSEDGRGESIRVGIRTG